MKIKIESMEVKEDQLEAIISVKAGIDQSQYRNSDIQDRAERLVVAELSKRIMLERGPSIMAEITNNQLINAVIMKVAGSIGGRD